MQLYLQPTYFLDADHPDVQAFAKEHSSPNATAIENAISLYYAVRDGFRYNPYEVDLSHKALKSSHLINRKKNIGYCTEKAGLLATCGRAVGIPTRLGFANVRNHIGTERLEERLKTNLMVFHGYTEFFLEGKWVKCTPAFNQALCDFLDVAPLEFDGKNDSILQEYDKKGATYMAFEHDYGQFHDIPHDLMVRELIHYYPHLFDYERAKKAGLGFHKEYFDLGLTGGVDFSR